MGEGTKMVNSAQRKQALTVPCKYCNAQPGEPCHNAATNQPLQFAAAHTPRLLDSTETPF